LLRYAVGSVDDALCNIMDDSAQLTAPYYQNLATSRTHYYNNTLSNCLSFLLVVVATGGWCPPADELLSNKQQAMHAFRMPRTVSIKSLAK
jgi:hypothetical protein